MLDWLKCYDRLRKIKIARMYHVSGFSAFEEKNDKLFNWQRRHFASSKKNQMIPLVLSIRKLTFELTDLDPHKLRNRLISVLPSTELILTALRSNVRFNFNLLAELKLFCFLKAKGSKHLPFSG